MDVIFFFSPQNVRFFVSLIIEKLPNSPFIISEWIERTVNSNEMNIIRVYYFVHILYVKHM